MALISTSAIFTGVLVLGVALALLRTGFRLRADHGRRSAAAFGWFAILAALHVLCAATLFYTLIPPLTRISADSLEVRTAGAHASPGASGAGRVVLLPEAPDAPGAERVADLASALRKYPDARRIRVTGAGLVARDRDAASSVVVEFEAVPLAPGLVELYAPARVARGAAWSVRGRVEGVPGAIAQLLDPAGIVVASGKVGEAGNFALLANPRALGPADYTLRIVHAARALQPDTTVPVVVTRGDKLRVLFLGGAPGPELKYLRRWAVDAGLDVRSDVTLGAVSRLATPAGNDRPAPFMEADLVVLDDRAWRALGVAGDRDLLDAVRKGTGVLLRITSPLGPSDRERLVRWGFASGHSATVPAPIAKAPVAAPASVLTLRAPSPAISAPDARFLSDPREGSVVGLYRVEGRGRLGLWWAHDSYRMILRGDAAAHGALWSGAFAELARPRTTLSEPRLDQALVRVGERQFVCNVGDGALVRAPDGRDFTLLHAAALPTKRVLVGSSGRTPATRACAAFWPRVSGWHEVRSRNIAWPFHVRPRQDSPGLFGYADREATLQLAARPAPAIKAVAATRSQPRWPWFLAWLAATALLWWLERASISRARR